MKLRMLAAGSRSEAQPERNTLAGREKESLIQFFWFSNVGFAILDEHFRFRTLNTALARMNGVSAKSHIGQTVRSVLGRAAEGLEPLLNQVFRTGQMVSDLEFSAKLRSRSEKACWLISYFPIWNRSGRVGQVGAVVNEIGNIPSCGEVKASAEKKETTQASGIAGDADSAKRLSPRELSVVRLIAAGRGNKEIASRLGLSFRTVETYRARAMLKLDVRSVTELVRYAIRSKIIAP